MEARYHAVLLPFPGALGHLNPMLELANRLSTTISVTFVYTQRDHSRLQQHVAAVRNYTNAQLAFEAISDRIPLNASDEERGRYFMSNVSAIEDDWKNSFECLISKLLLTTKNIIIISDYFLPFTQDVANKLHLPRVLFWPQSATIYALLSTMPVLELHGLSETGLVAHGKEIAAAKLLAASIPGLPTLRGSIDLPYCQRRFPGSSDPEKAMRWIGSIIDTNNKRLHEVRCILSNSAYNLERAVVGYLRGIPSSPPFVPIGPLLPSSLLDRLVDQTGSLGQSNHHQHVVDIRRPSFWQVEGGYDIISKWLDAQAPKSVVYVSVGSIVKASPFHTYEIALGLKASNQPFLWVIRGCGDTSSLLEMLPSESFLEETKEQGLIVPWAPQLHVLSHPAVGGFLTHSGWNSTLEAISMGVPMIVWPWIVDQRTNARMVVDKWGTGVELVPPKEDGEILEEETALPLEMEVGRLLVEKCIRLLMQEESGKEMQRKGRALSKCALEDNATAVDEWIKQFTSSRLL